MGRGKITKFNELTFTPGKAHVIEIECDLWPEIEYTGKKKVYSTYLTSRSTVYYIEYVVAKVSMATREWTSR